MELRPEEDPCRSRQAGLRLGEQGADIEEARQLLAIVRIGRIGGCAQVAHHQPKVETAQPVCAMGQRAGLGRGDALAVHAGVDVQAAGQGPAERSGEGGRLADLRQAAEHGREIRRHKARAAAGGQAVEDVDAGRTLRAERGAQGFPLRQPRDEETARTLRP
jgi:hypothetical protein